MSKSESDTKVIVRLVDREGELIQGIYQDSKDRIKIFLDDSETPHDKFDDCNDDNTKVFNFLDEFCNKDILNLRLKFPKKIDFDDRKCQTQKNLLKKTAKLVDLDLEILEDLILQKEKNIELNICYGICRGVISGNIYLQKDEDRNPRQKSSLEGVTVTLYKKNCNQDKQKVEVFKDITDAQGNYSFNDLESDCYRLTPEQKLDAERFNLEPGSLRLVNYRKSFFLNEGEKKDRYDFKYEKSKGIVRGFIFKDLDRDGNYFGKNEVGLQGVTVILKNNDGYIIGESIVTNDYGEYSIDAPPGTYILKFSSEIEVDGKEYTLSSAESQTITIKAGETIQAKPVGYQPERYGIEGKVTYEDDSNSGIEGVLIIIRDESGKNEIDRVLTNGEGKYFINTHRSGKFTVEFPERFLDGRLSTPNKQVVEVHSVAKLDAEYFRSASLNGGGFSGGGGSFGGNSRDALLDIASYMPTAQDNYTSSGRGGGGDRGSGNLKRVVDSAFNEVLGRNLRNDDPKAFLASLERAFTAEEVKGKTQYKWTPRSYAVQTELGGKISGAQASLYHRAKIAIDDALPLLSGLTPLKSDYDREEVEAARSIVRTEMLELVNELGLEGGPRIQRVEHIFQLIDKQLKQFKKVSGLDRNDVITVEEEQNFTNFLIIEDYIRGLREAWDKFTDDFTGTGSGYLGTQLVLLTRTLSVVAESVAEAYRAMDDVGLGPSERRTIPLDFSRVKGCDTYSSIFLEDLMSWIEHFASREAPDLIRDGGKRGVNAIQPVALHLSNLTKCATAADVPHVGFKTERVRRALQELAAQLNEVSRLAKELKDENNQRK